MSGNWRSGAVDWLVTTMKHLRAAEAEFWQQRNQITSAEYQTVRNQIIEHVKANKDADDITDVVEPAIAAATDLGSELSIDIVCGAVESELRSEMPRLVRGWHDGPVAVAQPGNPVAIDPRQGRRNAKHCHMTRPGRLASLELVPPDLEVVIDHRFEYDVEVALAATTVGAVLANDPNAAPRRVIDLVAGLDCDLVVVPEYGMTQTEAREVATRSPRARLTVAGSHRADRRNTASLIFHGDGNVSRVDVAKNCPVTASLHESDGPVPEVEADHVDRIYPPRIHLFNTRKARTLAVLICADALNRDLANACELLCVTRLVVPAATPSIQDFQRLARRRSDIPHADTIIVNRSEGRGEIVWDANTTRVATDGTTSHRTVHVSKP